MTKEKQATSSTAQEPRGAKPAKNQFLKDIKNELNGAVEQYLAEYGPEERQHISQSLYSLVEVWVKQSFINGIEAGERKAWIKSQKKGRKFQKAEKAVDGAIERQAEKDKQDNSRY